MENNQIISVAIDGPAGVGKSTVAKMLAKKLGWFTLETGALYRALTVHCLREKINFENEKQIIECVKNVDVEVQYINFIQHVYIDGKDFTAHLRKDLVDKNVAYVSKIPEVREKIKHLQQQLATKNNVVVEGRDIGTVVLKNSVNKFFLTACPETRANRRYVQLTEKNQDANIAEILRDIKERDYIDSTREVSPLKPADDAIIIETSNLNVNQVCELMYKNLKGIKRKEVVMEK